MIWCGSKDRYRKDVHLKEIGFHAENVITILGSIANMIRETDMTI